MSEFVTVCQTSDIAENESLAVDVDGRSILICHTVEGFLAVENKCSHQLQELQGGRIRKCFIFCPLHGQRFNLKDGTPIGKLTDKPIGTFACRVDGDAVQVNPAEPGAQD